MHDWSQNQQKMDQARKKGSMDNRKKQLLMSVVKQPEAGYGLKIKGNSNNSPRLLRLLTDSLEKTDPGSETPKFFSNPPIYNH